jgi:hypothetical protein
VKKSCPLWGQKTHYLVHNRPLLVHILIQINSTRTLSQYFLKNNFSFILPLTCKWSLPSGLFHSGLPTKIWHAFPVSPLHDICIQWMYYELHPFVEVAELMPLGFLTDPIVITMNTTKAHRVSRGIGPLVVNLGTKWGWMAKLTPSGKSSRYPLWTGQWVSSGAFLGVTEKNLLQLSRFERRTIQPVALSLYWLRYPPFLVLVFEPQWCQIRVVYNRLLLTMRYTRRENWHTTRKC